MSDESKPAAAPKQAEPKAVKTEAKPTVDPVKVTEPKPEATTHGFSPETPSVPAPPEVYNPASEAHEVQDLIHASSTLLGVLPEVLSGAAHKAGWEMTETVTVAQAKQAVSTFLSTPA